jgi:hypothetical protein
MDEPLVIQRYLLKYRYEVIDAITILFDKKNIGNRIGKHNKDLVRSTHFCNNLHRVRST